MKTIIITAAVIALSSCAGTDYIFRGAVETPYGSASSDGQTITVAPRPVVIPSK